MNPDIPILDFVSNLACEAGVMSLKLFDEFSQDDLEFKGSKDLVTTADRAVEEYIIGEIKEAFPEHDIFGEESGKQKSGSDYCWIIDPIDGTTSFVHEQPFYSVSIALQENGESIAGAVYAPRLKELFCAEQDKGAFLNGRRLKVSSRQPLINSVLSTGFACVRANLPDNNLPYFAKIVPELRGIRRYGSAAVDLGYVAAGRLEGFWEMNLKPYDYAAGILLVEEAGGAVTDFRGGNDLVNRGVVATNGLIHEPLLELLN